MNHRQSLQWLALGLAIPLLGCAAAITAKPSPKLEGRYKLQSVKSPQSTSPQLFPAEDWAKGLTLPENPSAILIQNGAVTASGTIAISGEIQGEVKDDRVNFTLGQDDDGTRLEIQFQGRFQPDTDSIQGTLTQVWSLTADGESGDVKLSGEAVFTR